MCPQMICFFCFICVEQMHHKYYPSVSSNDLHKTSQELRMLSGPVTLYSRVTMNVEIVVLNCQLKFSCLHIRFYEGDINFFITTLRFCFMCAEQMGHNFTQMVFYIFALQCEGNINVALFIIVSPPLSSDYL